MEFARKGRWEVTPAEAFAIQRELAGEVSLEDQLGAVELVGAVDLAVGRVGELGRAAAVVWRPDTGEVVESVAIEQPLRMPYIPGLLAFREGPLLEEVLRQVESEPDVLLLDGQGIAHPRGCGIACQFGVLLDRPTIGVAKSRLFGTAAEPGPLPGDRVPLLDPRGREIGTVLRTRERSKPLWVSPGSHVSPERAAEVVLSCVRGHRLPEPLWLADRLSKERLRGERAGMEERGNGPVGERARGD
ncbi:MAG TPA: endonuclease V [Armatimonadota bacterium]|nr:endonuclease V [Armatimonadota bacterium]